jgi:hypothetical protein
MVVGREEPDDVHVSVSEEQNVHALAAEGLRCDVS